MAVAHPFYCGSGHIPFTVTVVSSILLWQWQIPFTVAVVRSFYCDSGHIHFTMAVAAHPSYCGSGHTPFTVVVVTSLLLCQWYPFYHVTVVKSIVLWQ